MKIKTSELQGAALDWAVEEAMGWGHNPNIPAYSTDWALGGPIIESNMIRISENRSFGITESGQHVDKIIGWIASTAPRTYWLTAPAVSGPTPLIAAMRCYVASKLGDEIDVPDSLLRATA